MGQHISTSSPPSTQKIKLDSNIPINYKIQSPRFSVNDHAQIQQGIEHLNENGYAVFSDILSPGEITSNIDLFWEHLESLLPPYRIKRNDAKTWDTWPGLTHLGLMAGDGFGHSQFAWAVRGNPNVKKIFAQIWQTPELLVSFDAAGCFRDWHLNPKWKTMTGWYHCDQNPLEKPDRCSIQGIVSLTDNNEFTGGLVVVPQSHKHFKELQTADMGRNHVQVESTHPLLKQFQPRLVKCKAGDLLVFDSRCVHCNTPALDTNKKTKQMPNLSESKCPQLLRIVSYVCMSPTTMVPSDKLENFRDLREEFVMDRTSCTHWPAELNASGGPQHGIRKPLRLSGYQQSLIFGTNVDPEDEAAKQMIDM